MSTGTPKASDVGLDLEQILARVAAVAGATNDSQIAVALETGRSSIPTWRKREVVPFEPLFAFAKSRALSMDWLLTGKGEKHLGAKAVEAQQLMIRDAVLGDEKAARARFPGVDPSRIKYSRKSLQDLDGQSRESPGSASVALDLDHMRACIHALMLVIEKRGRRPQADKFAAACVFLYELSRQPGSMPLPRAAARLMETIT